MPDPLRDSPFMRACRREPTPYTPIWLMRQAGRYMPEYRSLRERVPFLDLCKRSELAAEVTVTAANRLGVDAAIIFADLLLIVEPLGFALEYTKGDGPVIHNPIRRGHDVERVRELTSVEPLDYVLRAVELARRALPDNIPLIGFAGAPFTLASYLIEGGASRNFIHTKTLMRTDGGAWHELMSRLAHALARYLNAQIKAGAQAVQLFDSWVGALSPDDYRRYALPYTRAVIEQVAPSAPVIHFGTGTAGLLEAMSEAGGDVIGIDWRIRLDHAWQRIGDRAIMGNLDPTVLLADVATLRQEARAILGQAQGRAGHIFNLGHGILPQTPVQNVVALVEAVHEMSALPGREERTSNMHEENLFGGDHESTL